MLRTYLVYHTVVRLCQFFVEAGKFFYDRKKKVLVVCLTGARLLLRPKKKILVAIVIMTGKKVLVVCLAGVRSLLRPEKKSSSRNFYAKLNVSNLNVTNLY